MPVNTQQLKSADVDVDDKHSRRLLPIQVFIVLISLVFLLWWFLDTQRELSLQQLISEKAHKFSSYIDADIRSRIPALKRVVSRWEQHGGTSRREFLLDANALLNDLPGFQALEWVDKNYHVRWIAPLEGNEQAQDLDLAVEKNRRVALEIARNDKTPTVSSVVSLVQGGKGILIYFPLTVKNEFDGFVLAVFKIDKWLDYVFSSSLDYSDEKKYYTVSVSIDDKSVFVQAGWRDDIELHWKKTKEVYLIGRVVTVTVQPTKHLLEDQTTYYPEIVATSGVVLSVLFAIILLLLQKTNAAITTAKSINFSLKQNIDERKRAEQEARRANLAKSDFLSSMSHELRTPLNAILGFGQLLKMDKNHGSGSRFVTEILNAGSHLLRLIEDILDFSKIETGHMELSMETVSLNEALGDCLVLIEELARKQNIKIINNVSDDNIFNIAADYLRFKQVLLNLLTNAIKYNSKKGSVTISAETVLANRLRISITDTGNGLSEIEQQKLFLPFERIGAEGSEIEGTGIGLVISKRLIELMAGSIGVDSKPGEGSTFWLEIQLAGQEIQSFTQSVEQVKEIAENKEKSSTSGKNILYIEDNPANLRLIENVIAAHTSYNLITAPDATKGLVLAESRQPDLILLDINLPGMDGFEAMQILQGREKMKNIPVIAVSAKVLESDIKRGNLAGFKSYVTKPIDIDDLLGKISDLLN